MPSLTKSSLRSAHFLHVLIAHSRYFSSSSSREIKKEKRNGFQEDVPPHVFTIRGNFFLNIATFRLMIRMRSLMKICWVSLSFGTLAH